jgi:hypothetical protein
MWWPLEVVSDPFVVFCVTCILTPVTLASGELTRQQIVDYFLEPSMIFSLTLLLLTVLETHVGGRCVPLSRGERYRARWYLLNGAIIHILMDGLVGIFKTNALFAANYAKIDKRYGDPLGDFRGSAVHIVSGIELFVKGPVCLLAYRAFHRGSPHRDVIEFFTCVTQAYGTIVYLGQELLTGMQNFDADWQLSFSVHYLIFFWFAILIGCFLYLIVPGWLGYGAYCRIVDSSRKANATTATAAAKGHKVH